MKKGFSLLLIFSLLLASTACGGGTSSDTTEGADSTTPADTEPAKLYDDDLPDKMDLGGYEFRVLVHENGNTADGAWAAFVDVETETGETLNDAAYKRNLEVEERLNITISCIEKGTFGQLTPQVVYPAIMAQEDLYDFVVLQNENVRLSPLLTDNCLLDLRTLDAINLNRPYYLQSANEVFNMKGKQYLVSGDYLCTLYSNSFIFTNMDKWKDLKLEDPYQLVRDGKWTLDKCFSLVKDTWRDLNGNTTPDTDDFWGITGIPETLGYCFHSGGGTLFDTSGDEPEFTVASERNVDILERLVEELKNPDACFTYSNSQVYREPFFNGNCLMFFSGASIKLLRDATFHTGILPFPKYDEEQENYYAILSGALGGIPVTVSDPERTATIVEALFSASSRYMEDAFIATYVEQKVLQDDESAEMFQLIRSSGRHNLVDFVDPESLLGGYGFIYNLLDQGNSGLTSAWEAIREGVESSYAEFWDKLGE